MKDQITDIVEDKEKAEKLQKIIEQKVQEEVQKTVKNLKNTEENQENEEQEEKEEVSRRNFLKKLGAGAIGLGAASLLPSASAFQVKSSHGFDVTTDGTEYFDVAPSGKVKVKNSALQIDEGQSIEDGTGVDRLYLATDRTILRDQTGQKSFEARNGNGNFIYSYSNTPAKIWDSEGGFNAVKYLTSASSPGILELTNAEAHFDYTTKQKSQFLKQGPSTKDGFKSTYRLMRQIDAPGNGFLDISINPVGTYGAELSLYSKDGNGTVGEWLNIYGTDVSPQTRLQTGADSNSIAFWDSTNNQPILTANEGGLVNIPNGDLRLATGRTIEDGAGTSRLSVGSGGTTLRAEDGQGYVAAIGSSNLVDMSFSPVNLRLSTRQAIEDGGGTERLSLNSNSTAIKEDAGTTRVEMASGGNLTLTANGVWYDPTNSHNLANIQVGNPGTFELTNANLDMGANNALFAASGSIKFANVDGTQRAYISQDGNGNLVAEDDDGNRTTIV